MDRTFINESNIYRRKPYKYMQNPTKVHFAQLGSKTYGYYEIPGVLDPVISLNKMRDHSPTEFKKFIPEVPTLKSVSPNS